MILINKAEKDIIAEELPDVFITRTMKQRSKRHHYYCEASDEALELLGEIRNSVTDREVGVKHRPSEKK